MLIPIDAIVAEVARISRATWATDDLASPPVLHPHTPARPVPVGHGPVFDDAGFALPSSPRWREAVDVVGRRVAPDTGGGALREPIGADAVACYVSFHSNPDRWGIYIPLCSLPILDELHCADLPMPRAAHFVVDCACARLEVLHCAPLRRAMHDRMQAGALLMQCAGPIFQPGPLRDFCDRLPG